MVSIPIQIIDPRIFLRYSKKINTSLRNIVPTKRNLKILVVDDNTFNLTITRKLIESLGYHASVATDGIQSVELCDKEHFDVILMDLAMPRMDGCTASKLIRQGPNSKAVIIALTASTETETRTKCSDAGMDGCISKPVSRSLLEQTIASYLQTPQP
jgi:CheY-like chemotaxis protein